jgi:DNA double-strand break repair helicase HerA and related ATPase
VQFLSLGASGRGVPVRAPRSLMGTIGDEAIAAAAAPPEQKPEQKKDDDEPGIFEKALGNSAVKSFLRSTAGALGREITRGLFGTRRKR